MHILSSIPARGNPRVMGILIALMGAFLMSFDGIFVRLSDVQAADTAFLFGLFSAISMPVMMHFLDPRGTVGAFRDSGWPVVVSGLLMLGSASGLIISLKHTSVANTFVIMSAVPALSALFSWMFLGEVTRRATWIAIVAIMIGIAVVMSGSFGSGHLFGDMMALIAVTMVSLNQTLLRKFPRVSRMASVGTGGAFLAIVMVWFATPSGYSANTWLIMGAMGLVTAPFGRVLSAVATRYITAPEAGMILMTEVVFAPVLAFLAFREIPAMASIAGGAIIVLAVVFYARNLANQDG